MPRNFVDWRQFGRRKLKTGPTCLTYASVDNLCCVKESSLPSTRELVVVTVIRLRD